MKYSTKRTKLYKCIASRHFFDLWPKYAYIRTCRFFSLSRTEKYKLWLLLKWSSYREIRRYEVPFVLFFPILDSSISFECSAKHAWDDTNNTLLFINFCSTNENLLTNSRTSLFVVAIKYIFFKSPLYDKTSIQTRYNKPI